MWVKNEEKEPLAETGLRGFSIFCVGNVFLCGLDDQEVGRIGDTFMVHERSQLDFWWVK